MAKKKTAEEEKLDCMEMTPGETRAAEAAAGPGGKEWDGRCVGCQRAVKGFSPWSSEGECRLCHKCGDKGEKECGSK